MKISIVINTYNAEKYLDAVLQSVRAFDEIVICDMYSTDNTINIAKKYHSKIIFHEKVGFVEPARDFAIQSASNEWVLVIDADEIVPNELKDFLYQQILNPNPPQGIKIPLKNYYMGQFMHALYPNYILRFFNKNNVSWPAYIHAQPIIAGRIFEIPHKRKELALIHLANDSVEQHITKLNNYTNKEVERRNKRYSFFSLVFSPTFRFFKQYCIKGGYKDGKAGFCNAAFNAIYKFVTIAKSIEKQMNK